MDDRMRFLQRRWDKMRTPKPFRLSELRYVSELELSNLAKTTADFYLVASAGEDEFEKSRSIWTKWRAAIDNMPPGSIRDHEEKHWQKTCPSPGRLLLVEVAVFY